MINDQDKNLNHDEFKTLYQSMAECVKKISDITKAELEKQYGNNSIKLPIDIYKIAANNGVDICECDLSGISQIRTNVVFGMLKKDDKSESGYCIEVEKKIDSFTKRYSIAHELGHYMLINNDDSKNPDTIKGIYSMPLLSSKIEEYLTDIYAIFLLMPLDVFLEEFSTFIEGAVREDDENFPINIGEWFQYLSIKAQMPNHNLELSYEYIRMAAYIHYLDLQNKPIREQFDGYAYLFV